jgi:hypothetical protein
MAANDLMSPKFVVDLLIQRKQNREKMANKACSGLAGFCAIYKHISGFKFILLSGIFPAHLPTTNASRWAAKQ